MKYLKLFEDFSVEDDEDEEDDEILDIFEIFDNPELDEDDCIEASFRVHLDKLFHFLDKSGIHGINIKNVKGKAIGNAMGGGELEVSIKIPRGIDKDILSKVGNDIERFEYVSWVKFTPTSMRIRFDEFTYTEFIPEIDINCDDI